MKANWIYVGGKAFGVPAVAGVMGHFIIHVLAESQFLGIDAHFDHVLLDAGHEIGQCFVGDHVLVDRLADRHDFSRFAVHLIASRVQKNLPFYFS